MSHEDYDASLWPTHHRSEADILAEGYTPPYAMTRSETQAILLEQIRELHRQLTGQRRINQMLSDQLTVIREHRQLEAQPRPQPSKPKIKDISK